MAAKLRFPTSLAGRYKLFAVATIILLLIISLFTYYNINKSITNGYESSRQRIEVFNTVNKINKDIHNINRLLDIYLINPQVKTRKEYLTLVNDSVKTISSLQDNDWINQGNRIHDLFALIDHLLELSYRSEDLMHLRITLIEMYPSMNISNNELFQLRYDFDDRLAQILMELKDQKPVNFEVYEKFVELRDKHRRMIMAYRLYMINRFASLFENQLDAQSQDIELYGYEILNSLEKDITKYLSDSDIEFVIGEPLVSLTVSMRKWLASFKKIKLINASDHWRADLPIIISEINPLFTKIHNILDQYELSLQKSMSEELTTQYNTSKNTSLYLLILTGFFILISISVYIALYMALLKPISSLSNSLQKNRKPDYKSLLPAFNNDEMRQFLKSMESMHEQVLKREEHLEYTATHDSLTGLPNRLMLIDTINAAILRAKKSNMHFAVGVLDLDRFKEINDTLGHGAGDKVICEVATRIKNSLRHSDIVARLGGDEFAILLHDIKENSVAESLERISESIAKPINLQGQNLYVGSSIGVALFPVHGEADEALIKNADIAMYFSKKSNLDFTIYNQTLDESNLKTLTLHSDLYNAIDNSELFMLYQPIYDISGETIYGFESLLRWNHPVFGVIKPDEFIPHAEKTGLITKITPWVIQQSLLTFSRLHAVKKDLHIGINISSLDLQNDSIVDLFDDLCRKYELPPKNILLDITERSLMADHSRIHTTLNKLNNLGIQIAIDDFGTGFSSLNYLSILPISMLKIDRSFILEMSKNENDKLIVQSIIDIARNFKLKSLAKGVFDNSSISELASVNCDLIQGNELGEPLDLDQVMSLLSPEFAKKITK